MSRNKFGKPTEYLVRLMVQVENEAAAKAFDDLFVKPYKASYPHVKSRKLKQARRSVIRTYMGWAGADAIYKMNDDYAYWVARNTHKLLYPKTPKEFYTEKLR